MITSKNNPDTSESDQQSLPKSNLTYQATHEAICKSLKAYIVAPDGCRTDQSYPGFMVGNAFNLEKSDQRIRPQQKGVNAETDYTQKQNTQF